MCGDGANDCSALKQADVGISLSDAEASIAAPFTSQVHNISCVIDVLREGRAALQNSFESFKFMVLSAVIQYQMVQYLYFYKTNVGNMQGLYQDLIVLIPLSIF